MNIEEGNIEIQRKMGWKVRQRRIRTKEKKKKCKNWSKAKGTRIKKKTGIKIKEERKKGRKKEEE